MSTTMTQSAADRRAEIEQDVIPYMRQLYPVAFNLTRDPGDAEDLVQETMIKTYRAFHQFEPGTNLRAWLHKIMRNTSISAHRKRGREPDSGPVFYLADIEGYPYKEVAELLAIPLGTTMSRLHRGRQ